LVSADRPEILQRLNQAGSARGNASAIVLGCAVGNPFVFVSVVTSSETALAFSWVEQLGNLLCLLQVVVLMGTLLRFLLAVLISA
jgi:hypothetical protein